MTGTSAAVHATCWTTTYRLYRTAGRKAKYGRFSVLPCPEIYSNLRIKDSVKIDPACGSGNFLTETYLCLRKLEDTVLGELRKGGIAGQMEFTSSAEEESGERISLSQFHGIEINDFAVSVAETALYISRLKANADTMMLLDVDCGDLPLKESAHIVLGNALRMDWNDVVPAKECDYIMGNPPFYGSRNQTKEQKEDVLHVWRENDGSIIKSARLTDYVASWFFLSAKYMFENKEIKAALVSTNSIIQGEQVELLWHNLERLFGVEILYAYTTFVWENEASEQAHVHCVIIGFTVGNAKDLIKTIYSSNGSIETGNHINGYLLMAPSVYLIRQKFSLYEMPQMSNGNRAYDGNNLVMSKDEKDELVAENPKIGKWIRKYFMGADLVKNEPRYVLWLVGDDKSYLDYPEITRRIDSVREMRQSAKNPSTKKAADKPHLFQTVCQPSNKYLAFPRVSSSRREYLPIAFLEPDVICGDKLIIVPKADLYVFGVLSAKPHKLWTWIFSGRLKSDISYSSSVYNNYPWPEPTDAQKVRIKTCAQAVLNARDNHPGDSLATLYDPNKMPADLLDAHKALDKAVEEAYGVDFNGDEEKIVAHLFKLYQEKVEELDNPKEKKKAPAKPEPKKVVVKVRKKQ